MLTLILPLITKAIDRLIPDKAKSLEIQNEIQKTLIENWAQINVEQSETNKIEAAHRSLFVAGWRPFVGWCCAIAMLWHFVLCPIVIFVLTMFGHQTTAPEFDMNTLMTVLMGMLGLGGLRTFEKLKGVTK